MGDPAELEALTARVAQLADEAARLELAVADAEAHRGPTFDAEETRLLAGLAELRRSVRAQEEALAEVRQAQRTLPFTFDTSRVFTTWVRRVFVLAAWLWGCGWVLFKEDAAVGLALLPTLPAVVLGARAVGRRLA